MTALHGNGIEASTGGPHGRRLAIGGPLAIVAVFALVVLVGLARLWERSQTITTREHMAIVQSVDRLGCILVMSPDVKAIVRDRVRNLAELDRVCMWLQYPSAGDHP